MGDNLNVPFAPSSPTGHFNLYAHWAIIWLAFRSHPIIDTIYAVILLVGTLIYFVPLPMHKTNPFLRHGTASIVMSATIVFVLYQYVPVAVSALNLWGSMHAVLPAPVPTK